MRNAKLLVVEDDPLFGGALREVITGAGYDLRVAVSGAEALAAVGPVHRFPRSMLQRRR